MSDLLAPPTIVLRRRSTLETLALDPARELGAGGEARVLALSGDDSLVAKLYHQPTLAKARKVALMMEEPPELDASAARLAWPRDLLFDGSGAFAGFLMPRAEGPRVFELYNPVTRRRTAPMADYAFLLRAAANVAAAFEALHARGYVIGDVNESNLLVADDASVTLVDTDSLQVRDPADGAVHRSRVGKAEFTPPELQGRSFGDFDRSPEHDRFGLAVLLFLLLMEGTHPFAGRLDDGREMPPIEERIRRGLFPHDDHAEIRPPRLAPDFSLLAPGLRVLFVRCFEDGHADPSARPTAAEWRAALAEAEAKLVACDVNPRHRHGRHLGSCPWCARMAVLRVPDPFPADARTAPGRPARILAPPASTAGVASQPIPPASTAGTGAQPTAPASAAGAASRPIPPASTAGVASHPIAPASTAGAASHPIPPASTAGAASHPIPPASTTGAGAQPIGPAPSGSSAQTASAAQGSAVPPAASAVPRPVVPVMPPVPAFAVPPAVSLPPAPKPKRKSPARSTVAMPMPAAPGPARALGQQPAPAPAASPAPPEAYHLPGGADWLRQAMGRMGALHPGAWLAPSLALLLGPTPVVVLVGLVMFPLLFIFLVLTLSHGLGPKQDRLLGTFAVPAAVLLVLSIWIFSATGNSWLLPGLKDGTPPRYETVIPPGTAHVQLGLPRAFLPGSDSPILENHGAILFRLRERYPDSRDRRVQSLRLVVHVRVDGTVDPGSVQIADSTDPLLAEAVEEVAQEMVFVPPVSGGRVTPGWVWMDVRYGW